ncbi:hypothetical protein [Microbispora rosea]|uniref:hypothetical protein n=1 Tax=Microbispora rosea TaxID=58117 RepID=UPI001E3B6E02|nr:hypothetical protein [Microbispora rosea]
MTSNAIATAELSVGVLLVSRPQELAHRMKILQAAEAQFDPLLFDETAACEYGLLLTAVVASGRNPHLRTADLMIACVAIANQPPLYTCNPKNFKAWIICSQRFRSLDHSGTAPETCFRSQECRTAAG